MQKTQKRLQQAKQKARNQAIMNKQTGHKINFLMEVLYLIVIDFLVQLMKNFSQTLVLIKGRGRGEDEPISQEPIMVCPISSKHGLKNQR